MERREFITFLGGAAAWPLATNAQTSPELPRVGYIGGASRAEASHRFEAFQQALRDLGYVEGQTVALEVRWADGRMERAVELVSELVGLKVDVLVAGSTQIALAAKQAIMDTGGALAINSKPAMSLAERAAVASENDTWDRATERRADAEYALEQFEESPEFERTSELFDTLSKAIHKAREEERAAERAWRGAMKSAEREVK